MTTQCSWKAELFLCRYNIPRLCVLSAVWRVRFVCSTQWVAFLSYLPPAFSCVSPVYSIPAATTDLPAATVSLLPLLRHNHYLSVWSVSQQQHQMLPLLAESFICAYSAHIYTMQCHDTGRSVWILCFVPNGALLWYSEQEAGGGSRRLCLSSSLMFL